MTENSEPTDLLGDPLRPLPDKRGRRKLQFPKELYEKVEVLAAGNLSQEEIADAIGISVPSLTKYFRKELDKALSRQKAEVLSLLATAARGGNVAAIRAWNAELDKQRAAQALRDRERPREARQETERQPRPRAEPAEGKKEARQRAADQVAAGGSKFAPPPPPPRLTVVG